MKNTYPNLQNLSVREKIGQIFFIGIAGEEFDYTSEKFLEEIKPGGICLFSRNIKDAKKTRKLLDEISRKLPFQPFLSLDQEGGLVDRLRRIVEPFPSAKDISRNGKTENAEKFAALTAEIIRILGFNMNFAPIVDISSQTAANSVLDRQSRTYGKNEKDVFDFTSRYLEHLQNSGIIGCLKHFPGIGAVEFDPHEELPFVDISEDYFYNVDLFPYLEHFKNRCVYALMTAHITFPNFYLQESDTNGKLLPASLSPNFVTKLLRQDLGFENLVLTDDLEMGAIINNYGIGEAAKLAFLAGSDFLLICNRTEAVYEGFESVLKAFEDGEISETRIDESLRRISRVRSFLQKPLEFSEQRLSELSNEIRDLKETL